MDDAIDLDLMFTTYLDLSSRVRRVLHRNGIESLRQLIQYTEKELLELPGIGSQTTIEIQYQLAHNGLKLGTTPTQADKLPTTSSESGPPRKKRSARTANR